MYIIFLIIYLLVAVSLVLLIMIQHGGKDIDVGGATFNIRNSLGGGFGTSSGLMTRLIAILGLLFFLFSLLLGNISNKFDKKDYTIENNSLKQSYPSEVNDKMHSSVSKS